MMSNSDVSRIVEVRPVAEHTVEVKFGDGFVGRVDLKPALWGEVFEALKDPQYFCQVSVQDETIRWPNDADFCPDVLRFWCEAGGVQSREDTDAYFAQMREAAAT